MQVQRLIKAGTYSGRQESALIASLSGGSTLISMMSKEHSTAEVNIHITSFAKSV